jgi:hypothetical protein
MIVVVAHNDDEEEEEDSLKRWKWYRLQSSLHRRLQQKLKPLSWSAFR